MCGNDNIEKMIKTLLFKWYKFTYFTGYFKYNILLCVKMNIVKKTSKMDAIVNIHHIIGHYFHVNDKVKQSLLNRSKLLSVHISDS